MEEKGGPEREATSDRAWARQGRVGKEVRHPSQLPKSPTAPKLSQGPSSMESRVCGLKPGSWLPPHGWRRGGDETKSPASARLTLGSHPLPPHP